MERKKLPSAVMYRELKRLGVSNREAATMLLNTQLTFDGRPLEARIKESSQLSRRIVYTAPGEIPRGLFNDFHFSCPSMARVIVDTQSVNRYGGDLDRAAKELYTLLAGSPVVKMEAALHECGIDSAVFRNMVTYVDRVELPRERDRFTLLLMLFVVTGCLGNPRAASIFVVEYATDILGADFQTAQTIVGAVSQPETEPSNVLLGLVRVTDGHIKAGSKMHVLSPEGTEIGMLPEGKHVIADVDSGVSRRHAFIWREDGRWLVRDLGSTNGTTVLPGLGGDPVPVAPASTPGTGVELSQTDLLCLGATTQFMVVPVLG